MAEGLLRVRLLDAGIEATVASVGTLGWSERGATPKAVEAMRELGIDISEHRSRKLEAEDLDVDLIVAMTRDHAGAVIARDPGARSRVFLPAELIRLARDHDARSVPEIARLRTGPMIGRAHEQVADPAGETLEVYRSTAARLDRDLSAIVGILR